MYSYLLKNFSLIKKKLVACHDKLTENLGLQIIVKPILACFGFIVHLTPSFPAKRQAKTGQKQIKGIISPAYLLTAAVGN